MDLIWSPIEANELFESNAFQFSVDAKDKQKFKTATIAQRAIVAMWTEGPTRKEDQMNLTSAVYKTEDIPLLEKIQQEKNPCFF